MFLFQPITSVIWSSYVDLIIFLASSGSILALDTAVTHSSLLERLSVAATSDGMNQKVGHICLTASCLGDTNGFYLITAYSGDSCYAASASQDLSFTPNREG